jgi:hypothetical protein
MPLPASDARHNTHRKNKPPFSRASHRINEQTITRRTQHTLQHHGDTHCRHSDAVAYCSTPTPMQAPMHPRHQSCSLMHASPHTARITAMLFSYITIHNITLRTQHTLHHHDNTHSGHSDAAAYCSSPTPTQAPSHPRHQCHSLMHASPHTSPNTTAVLSRTITSYYHPQHTAQHTLHHQGTTYTRHSDAAACCSALMLMQAPPHPRHQSSSLIHASSHNATNQPPRSRAIA